MVSMDNEQKKFGIKIISFGDDRRTKTIKSGIKKLQKDNKKVASENNYKINEKFNVLDIVRMGACSRLLVQKPQYALATAEKFTYFRSVTVLDIDSITDSV